MLQPAGTDLLASRFEHQERVVGRRQALGNQLREVAIGLADGLLGAQSSRPNDVADVGGLLGGEPLGIFSLCHRPCGDAIEWFRRRTDAPHPELTTDAVTVEQLAGGLGEEYAQPTCAVLRTPFLSPVSGGLLVPLASVERVYPEVADTARERAVVISHDHGDVSHSGPSVRDLGDGPSTGIGAYIFELAFRRGVAESGRCITSA